MPLHVRTGTAFRWRPTRLSGEASDVMRAFESDGAQLALLANGYEGGFSACFPPASRLILDLFVEAWSAGSGPVRARLDAAFEAARRKFIERAGSLVTADADFPDDVPAAVLLAVAIEGATVHVSWAGGDVAVLARGGEVIASTTPHTLVERFRREHPELTDLSQVPNVLARSITSAAPHDAPDHLDTAVAPGDTLLLLSRSAFRGPCVSVDDAARAAAEQVSPAVLAERLAQLAFAETDAPYAAVIALRLEGSESSRSG